jgi:hypothetical protein
VGDFCARDTFDKHEDALQGTLSEEQTQQIAEEAVKEYESEFLNPGQ